MSDPLNLTLYRRLKRLFGHVRVSGAGEAFIGRVARNQVDENGRPPMVITQEGEYYRVCCAYCNDTRYRLYVNHRFGTRNETGQKMNFLAYCFNEHCLAKPENLFDFVDKLNEMAANLADAHVARGREVPEEERVVTPPGPCVLLTQLKPDHAAVAYLASRRFDAYDMAKRYDLSFCVDSRYYLARNRLIIPIWDRDVLRGWQARYVGELPWKDPERKRDLPPKYFSCPGSKFRSRCIYNFDSMREWETGIICEGVTDVWRLGGMAGCVFGNSMTVEQKRKFTGVFRRRSGVLLLDPEEYESASTQELVRYMREHMDNNFCAVKLPDGTDPGSLDRDFLLDYVYDEAKRRGVKVLYRRVA